MKMSATRVRHPGLNSSFSSTSRSTISHSLSQERKVQVFGHRTFYFLLSPGLCCCPPDLLALQVISGAAGSDSLVPSCWLGVCRAQQGQIFARLVVALVVGVFCHPHSSRSSFSLTSLSPQPHEDEHGALGHLELSETWGLSLSNHVMATPMSIVVRKSNL